MKNLNTKFNKYIKNIEKNEPADTKIIKEVEKELKVNLPIEYKEFIMITNGIEGEIGKNSYISLWKIEDLTILNNEYAVEKYTPGLLYIGSDGGNIAYGFDKRNKMKLIEIPFICVDYKEIKKCGESFLDFLEYLYKN